MLGCEIHITTATMLGLEKYGRIDFSWEVGPMETKMQPKCKRAPAKDPGELVKISFCSLSTPNQSLSWRSSFLFHQIVPVAKPNPCLDQSEVNISPKMNISAHTPKMALHENPAPPGSWIVIFLHGPQKRQYFCT